jgi:hypothetical protein
MEIGLGPVAAVNFIMLVGGRACVWGDGALALVQASGLMTHFAEGVMGDGDGRVGWCEVRRGAGDIVRKEFSVDHAREAKLWEKAGPWSEYPDRMLHMRPRAWCLRDTFADVLNGLGIFEEVMDVPGNEKDVALILSLPPVADLPAADAATTAESNKPDPAGRVTQQTLTAIAAARDLWLKRQGIDPNGPTGPVYKAWRAKVSEYGAKSAENLTEGDAGRLLADLRGEKAEPPAVEGKPEGAAAEAGPTTPAD